MFNSQYLRAKIALTIFMLFILSSLPAQAVRTMTANPINIASRLILYTDSAKVATALQYYGYMAQSRDNGYTVFAHPDGPIIRFMYPKTDSKENFPTVQIKTKIPKTEAEKILKDLDYKKTSTGYETTSSKYSTHITSCSFDPNNTITFQRLPK